MNYRRALITGGAGLIGSHIADLLVKQDLSEVVVLDDFSRGQRENLAWAAARGKVRIVEGDIRDQLLIRKLMEGIDVVFHQAAIRITQCAEHPRLALEVLADGTFNVIEAAARAGVKKVIAASSASVYGLAEEFPTPEDHHGYNNRTIYGAAKLFNEGLLRSFHQMRGLDYVALRYFNVYGPRMDRCGAYTEVGDGTQTMDFVFVEDVARANVLAASSEVTDHVFNIASGIETSLNELATTLGRVMGKSFPPIYGPARKVNAVPRRVADTRKAEHVLGFKSQVSLEEGLAQLVSWWEQRRAIEPSTCGVL
jgi:UDP-glucose 4-epimerase